MDKRTILIAEDELAAANDLQKKLTAAGYDTCVAHDGYAALSKAKVVMPDLILLDVMIRGMHGVEIKNRLNQEESTINIPVIFIADKSATDQKIKDFLMKADGVVTKPFDFKELLGRIEAISGRRKLYEQIYMTDPITGLNNVHVFKKNFTAFFNVARRYHRVFSFGVIDLDNFKMINDTHGHAVGDTILKSFADAMKSIFRDTDILIRYGGDEFVVLFPETDEHQAKEAIHRLKKAVKELRVPVNNSQDTIGFSFSAGVASYRDEFKRPSDLFELADQNMYSDKKENKLTLKKPFADKKPTSEPKKRRHVI